MQAINLHRTGKAKQFTIAIGSVCLVGAICFICSSLISYRVVGFILLVTVSLVAMTLDILPVLLAAVLSALIWDFFFIPPHYTFQVGSTEDTILLTTYFIVAMVSAVLTNKIRRAEKESLEKEEKAHTVKLYNTLLNSLSHELRTPIAAIVGATDNLQHSGAGLTPQNRAELLEEIAMAALRLNRQVDNLLNMSRLESGIIAPKKDWCDISEVVYEVVRQVEESGAEQSIHISINPDLPFFRLDRGMLEQVIANLLNNAVRYTDSASEVIISAACHADVLELVIEDNGKGFPPEDIQKVFDKFYRLHDSGTGGTGLGLSIVKGFTEAMGGSIGLRNRIDGGARFTLEIPAETSYLKNLKNE
jgi:two-component system sensor histidine kinase KdpD